MIKALDVLPEETEEEKSKREYFETLTSLMQDHPLMMHVYLRLYQSSKANDTFKITKKEEEGTIYIGELNEQGRFNGKGVMMNGSMMYAGFWSNGLPSGFFYVFKNGNERIISYTKTNNEYPLIFKEATFDITINFLYLPGDYIEITEIIDTLDRLSFPKANMSTPILVQWSFPVLPFST